MTKDYPLISILIPAYNHEKYVKEALDSILDESYPNLEAVIVDDGSSDNTPKIIEQWIEQHQKEIKTQYRSRPNKGITKTLNELIDMAEGEYTLLFASDDRLINNGLSKKYEYFLKNPDKLSVVTDSIVIDEHGKKIHDSVICDVHKGRKELYLDDEKFKREIIQKWAMASPRMDNIKIYKMVGKYDESLSIDDWDMCLRIAATGTFGFIDESHLIYITDCNIKSSNINFKENK